VFIEFFGYQAHEFAANALRRQVPIKYSSLFFDGAKGGKATVLVQDFDIVKAGSA
jgi:hypothetical protein